MTTNNYRINNNLYLIRQSVQPKTKENETIVINRNVNHILVVDCSGSMSFDLGPIREQIKRKVPKLLKEGDTLSIIWFSGKNQCGILLEGEPVATLTDLKTVEQAIDRWLRPVGLTGFKEPLDLVPALVSRLNSKNNGVSSLMFLSDGYDNQWSKNQILASAESVGGVVSAATFVEYGYYADRQLLSEMAEKCGGSLIFAEDFNRYDPKFELIITKKVSGARKIIVNVDFNELSGFVFALKNGELLTFAVKDSGTEVEVPEDLGEFWYLSEIAVGDKGTDLNNINASYAAVSLYAQRMDSNTVLALLKSLGDVRFIKLFGGCFGKQRYSDFVEATRLAAFDDKLKLVEGFDPNAVPPDDAFTVLDLLDVLASDEDNHVLLDSKDFVYKRISRGTVDAVTVLTDEEQEQVNKLTEEMNSTKSAKKKKEIALQIAEITDKPEALKFVAEEKKDGYSINKLVYNENFPNISINIRREGTVDLSSRLTGETMVGNPIPNPFPTFQYRSYAIIKDGLVNVEKLPARITAGTIRKLKESGMPETAIVAVEGETDEQTRKRVVKAGNERHVNVCFDLKSLPIINRNMVKSVSAKTLFEKEFELLKVQAAKKVYDSFKKDKFPEPKSKGFVDLYGADRAKWLEEQGFTDYSGFNPKRRQAESVDFYMAKELKTSLSGYSSLPSLTKVLEKMDAIAKDKTGKKKLTVSESLMEPYVKNLLEADSKGNLSKEWLEGLTKASVSKTRELITELAKQKFSIVVGQVWPSEWATLDENTLTITVDGVSVDCKLEMKETRIDI